MGHTTTKQTYPFSKKKKKTHSLVSESQTHNKHEPSRRAQGPKTQNEKTERREGEKGKKKKKKKKKFLSAIPISDSEQRQARGEVERVRVWETYRRQEEGGGALVVGLSVKARSEQSGDFESERLNITYFFFYWIPLCSKPVSEFKKLLQNECRYSLSLLLFIVLCLAA